MAVPFLNTILWWDPLLHIFPSLTRIRFFIHFPYICILLSPSTHFTSISTINLFLSYFLLLFSNNFSFNFFFPLFFVSCHLISVIFSALPVLLRHLSSHPSSPRFRTKILHSPLNFSVTYLFIFLVF